VFTIKKTLLYGDRESNYNSAWDAFEVAMRCDLEDEIFGAVLIAGWMSEAAFRGLYPRLPKSAAPPLLQ